MSEPILRVQNLRLVYETLQGSFSALNGVDLQIDQGEVLGLVGESGCGKSSLGLTIMRILPTQTARVLEGSKVLFKGHDLLALTEKEMEKIRGAEISMVFQEPLTCLNPVFSIGDQLGESIRIGLEGTEQITKPKRDEIREQALSWLKRVEIPDPESALEKYPHELSGGMRQRILISMAMAAKPSLMLVDEPTSALDVTTQAQILKLIRSLVEEIGTSVLFISHDLAVVAQISERVAVMYAGVVVEEASVFEIFEKPVHRYTQALLASFPSEETKNKRLEVIRGTVPNLMRMPSGCPFHPRCKYARGDCSKLRPELKEVSFGHRVACSY